MEGLLRGRLALVATLVCVAACGPSPEPRYVDVVDLLAMLPAAQLRAAPPVENSIRADLVGPPGDLRPACGARLPRVSFGRSLPRRARVATAVTLLSGEGVSLRFYIGDRTYELLFSMTLSAAGSSACLASGRYRSVRICRMAMEHLLPASEMPWRLSFYADPAPEVSWRGNDRRYR